MKKVFISLFLFGSITTLAQERPGIDVEDFAERLFQMQDEDINYETLYETLLLYYTHPLNLNEVTPEALGNLYVLSPKQISSFFAYRNKNGSFLSIYELQAIPDFDLHTIENLRPFVTLKTKKSTQPLLTRIFHERNNYLLLRYSRTLENQEGFLRKDSTGFQGDPNRYYGRFRVHHPDDFSLGFTFEKDPGESFNTLLDQEPIGFDYYSGHFLLENKGAVKSFIIGDFQLQFGQGLVFGSGFSPGKGAETINTTKRNTLGIRPYSSVLETGFFRGTGTTIKTSKLETTVFASQLHQDARLLADSTQEYVSSIQSSGLHRTANEIMARNQLKETNLGFGLKYDAGYQFNIGATGLYTFYSSPIQPTPTNYNQYAFNGDRNWVTSIYANYNWQNFMLFGETAISKSSGIGAIGGFMASLTPNFDMSMVLRSYDKNFHSPYGKAFGENSRTINEKGFYWGFKYQPVRDVSISFYLDKFRFPWLKYRVEAPSDGYEYLGRVSYQISKKIKMYAQLRAEEKEQSATKTTPNLKQLTYVTKFNYLFNLDFELNKHFGLRTKIQSSTLRELEAKTSGFTIIQDFNTSFWKIRISARYALFSTDNYDNRQYAYERDVLYAFSIPAYYGTGSRKYFLIQYNATPKIRFYARYSRYDYLYQQETGSGLNTSYGNKKAEIKLMIRYTL